MFKYFYFSLIYYNFHRSNLLNRIINGFIMLIFNTKIKHWNNLFFSFYNINIYITKSSQFSYDSFFQFVAFHVRILYKEKKIHSFSFFFLHYPFIMVFILRSFFFLISVFLYLLYSRMKRLLRSGVCRYVYVCFIAARSVV